MWGVMAGRAAGAASAWQQPIAKGRGGPRSAAHGAIALTDVATAEGRWLRMQDVGSHFDVCEERPVYGRERPGKDMCRDIRRRL